MTTTPLEGELRGRTVALRAFRPDELEAAWNGHQGHDPTIMPMTPDRRRLEQRIERSGRMRGGEIDLAIEVDGRLIGTIQTHTASPGLRSGVYELGILIWDPNSRGRGYGSDAVEVFTTWLFDQADARRVQAGTSPGNAAMRRTLEKLGFAERGLAPGPRAEYVLYAVSAEEWRARR